MNRVVARLPDTVSELFLVRMGIQIRRGSAWFFARRLRSKIRDWALFAMAEGAGLLCSESFSFSPFHFGFLQYWRSFDDLESWAHDHPHSEWWRSAVERMRQKRDLGVYHEAFLVRPADIESIYMDCEPTGLATFGSLAEPLGPLTTSRGRLGRGRS